jgi:CheY-like chemotaxis protein
LNLSDGRPPTILIVEDINWIRSGMKKSVERYGYRVAEAADDVEAFQALERESPALILTEEQLPTFDSLLARLRDRPDLHSIPIAIVNPDAEDGARLREAFLLPDYDRIASLLTSLRQ